MFKIKYGLCLPAFDLLRSSNISGGRYRRTFSAAFGVNCRVRNVIKPFPNGNTNANDIRYSLRVCDGGFSDTTCTLGTHDLTAMPRGRTECAVSCDERLLPIGSAEQNLLKASAILNIASRRRTTTPRNVKVSSTLPFWRQFFFDDSQSINAKYT